MRGAAVVARLSCSRVHAGISEAKVEKIIEVARKTTKKVRVSARVVVCVPRCPW
jgi:hypothetical protein